MLKFNKIYYTKAAMKKTLFAWIGGHDLEASADSSKAGLGPICTAVTAREFDEAILLSNYPVEKSAQYRDWLSLKTKTIVKLKPIDLADPTDYRLIYDHSKREIREHLKVYKSACELTFHLSPGTPSMATIWVILANSLFPAKLIRTSKEKGLEDVELPFDIAVDYLPDLIKRKDEGIGALFDRVESDSPEFNSIIHRSKIMKRLISRAMTVAPHFLPVLIQGESGTGKELLAAAIHKSSLFHGEFVAVNCGAIPSELVESELFGHIKGTFTGATSDKTGYIKAAKGGTLFLDEIGELSPAAQVKLLRVLQEGTYTPVGATVPEKTDARIIAATNRNLVEEISSGRFREDLFHRLAVAILIAPPLREREGDVGLLIDYFLDKANERLSAGRGYTPRVLTAASRSLLLKHTWPGNVRELQNTLIRAALWSSGNILAKQDIQDALLPVAQKEADGDVLWRSLGDGLELEKILADVARHYLGRAVNESGGNKTKASKLLNFKNYQTLDNWLKKYGITPSLDTEE